jgi:deoxyribodipyrimidine photo-lyase
MTDWPPTRAEDERILSAFRPRMGRRYSNGRNTEPGPGAQKALSPCGRRRLVLESGGAEDMLRLPTRGTHDPAM